MSTLNFNKYRPPIMELEMPDKDNTVLHITPPTVDLQEELQAKASDLNSLLTGGADEQRAGFYDLAARLMSCNRDMIKLTPELLRKKYNLDVEDLVVFFKEYTDFITGIEHAKN
jgi:hypothetical protein